jgi:hypothetical protein
MKDFLGPHPLVTQLTLLFVFLISLLASEHAYNKPPESTTEPPAPLPKTRP